MSYPKWIYHASEPARIVADAAEQEAAGPEWAETPAAFEELPEQGTPAESFEDLIERLEPVAEALELEAEPAVEAPRRRGRPRKVAEGA